MTGCFTRPRRLACPIARVAWTCAVVTVVAACTPPIRQFDLKYQPLTCEQANEDAYRTLQSMGFTVTAVDPARIGRVGTLHATREDRGSTQPVTVTITCTDSRADIEASEDNRWVGLMEFKRGFYLSFTATVTQASVSAAAAREEAQRPLEQKKSQGLQVGLEPLPGAGAKLEFAFDFPAAQVLPVLVTINNVTARAYTFDPSDIVLIQKDGARVHPLSIAATAQRVADAARGTGDGGPADAAEVGRSLQARLLQVHSVGAEQSVKGYLFYPLAAYVKGRVSMEDQATEETEGFLVEFQ
jgi:hypothetical protein